MRKVFVLILAGWLLAPGSAQAGVDLPGGGKIETVDFERHIMGLLSKVGCNLGSCHGSFQGKNGFRLSLFGYEPDMDYAALTRDNLGRRIDRITPENSLLLMKGTGRLPHEGGSRFGKESWINDVFQEWIRTGAQWNPGSGEIVGLEVNPPDFAVLPTGSELQLKVTATFADGSKEEVTPFCDFRISDEAIATITPFGQLTAVQPGDSGLSIVYRGAVRAVRVLVPSPEKAEFSDEKIDNVIDQEVLNKLKLLNMAPSAMADDYEFLRRVTIDTIGSLPTPDEIRAFVNDKSPNKHARKIDELLNHPLHAALWATKLSDITGNNTDALENPTNTRVRRSQMWHDWLRKRIAENQPYDQLVGDILTATSREGRSPKDWLKEANKLDEELGKGFDHSYADRKTLDLFWRRQGRVADEVWGEKVAAAFLGVRLECAQCHKHPTDRWTQEDYWSFASIFTPVTSANNNFSDNDAKKAATEVNTQRREKSKGKNNNQIILVREMYFSTLFDGNTPRPKAIPESSITVTPKALGGPDLPHEKNVDTREKLWQWMKEPSNPFFARSFVNRVWAHYFGVGLVDPVDDFSQANPPSNERLLDALAQQFVASGYNIRELERLILNSRTYQRSSEPNESNKFDKNNFSRAYVRPMMAEQVVDVLNAAIGVDESFGNDAPKGAKMIEVGASRLNNRTIGYVLQIFGRPPRTTACDCERAMEPALPQTLFRMTDANLMGKIHSNSNFASKLAKDKKLSDEQVVEELFLATLCRKPTKAELKQSLSFIADEKDRVNALQDIVWALINTREFILNH